MFYFQMSPIFLSVRAVQSKEHYYIKTIIIIKSIKMKDDETLTVKINNKIIYTCEWDGDEEISSCVTETYGSVQKRSLWVEPIVVM